MADITLGIFSSTTDAEYAIHDLQDAGYDPKDISILMRNRDQAAQISDTTGSNLV